MRKNVGTTTTREGDRLAWTVEGDGPAMLIMNGLASSVDPHWTQWIAYYRARFSVLAWDYRGHGASIEPADHDAIAIERFADDGAAVLTDAALPSPAVVCGLSMGVQTALELASRHKEQVRALILLCGTAGHALDYIHPSARLRAVVTKVVRRFEALPPRLLRLLALPVTHTPLGSEVAYRAGGVVRGKTTPEQLSAILTHAAGRSPRVLFRLVAAYVNHSAWDTLADIRVPTLIIAGDRDDLVPIETAMEMHRRIPGSELHIVRGHGHLAQVEAPGEVHRVVDAFLARHQLG